MSRGRSGEQERGQTHHTLDRKVPDAIVWISKALEDRLDDPSKVGHDLLAQRDGRSGQGEQPSVPGCRRVLGREEGARLIDDLGDPGLVRGKRRGQTLPEEALEVEGR